jgi:CO/xanthine dehydrogenase FAD-binding subunit
MHYQQYHLARSLPDAIERLSKDQAARPIAGGTDLMIQIASAQAKVKTLVDISQLEELKQIQQENGTVSIGAAVTYQQIIDSPVLRQAAPLLVEASRRVGAAQIQHMGTIGGNIANASPAGDTLPVLYALDAWLVLESPNGRRVLPLNQFILGVRRTALQPGELITQVCFAGLDAQQTGSAFVKFGLRQSQAISVVSAAVVLQRSNSHIESAAVALGAVAPTAVRSPHAEAALCGQTPSADLFAGAGAACLQDIRPIDDIRGSAAFRRHLAKKIVQRALEKAEESSR